MLPNTFAKDKEGSSALNTTFGDSKMNPFWKVQTESRNESLLEQEEEVVPELRMFKNLKEQ